MINFDYMRGRIKFLLISLILSVQTHRAYGQDDTLEYIDQLATGYFNNDSIEDLLIIYANNVELDDVSFIDKCIPHKSILFIGDEHGHFTPLNQSQNLFPCPLYNGRSDNTYDTLNIEENSIIWRTTVAPFSSDSYSIETFTFRYSFQKKYFTLTEYLEKFYSSSDVEVPIEIHLIEDDLIGADSVKFDMNNWLESGHIFSVQNVIVNEEKIAYWESLSKQFKDLSQDVKANYILMMIKHYFPNH